VHLAKNSSIGLSLSGGQALYTNKSSKFKSSCMSPRVWLSYCITRIKCNDNKKPGNILWRLDISYTTKHMSDPETKTLATSTKAKKTRTQRSKKAESI